MILLDRNTLDEILAADPAAVLQTLKAKDWGRLRWPCPEGCDHSQCDHYLVLGIHYFHKNVPLPYSVPRIFMGASLLQELVTGQVYVPDPSQADDYKRVKEAFLAFARGDWNAQLDAKEKARVFGDPAVFTRSAFRVLEWNLFPWDWVGFP